ncbi:MAG: hypothetical protein M1371_04120 [Actinobacteria bacterium]|nr:hypothetical protein [Actinomycetota bacterium]
MLSHKLYRKLNSPISFQAVYPAINKKPYPFIDEANRKEILTRIAKNIKQIQESKLNPIQKDLLARIAEWLKWEELSIAGNPNAKNYADYLYQEIARRYDLS